MIPRVLVLTAAIFSLPACAVPAEAARGTRARDLGIVVGTLPAGRWNAITDVAGVTVGHQTITRGTNIRTGVTAILPHDGNIFQEKIPAAIHVGNGYGKLSGYTQVEELGNIETPIILTNTLSVGTAMAAVVEYTLSRKGNENVRSVNAVVGETNDGFLNDIRGMHVTGSDVLAAIASARSGAVREGTIGAGTGTVCFGFKGGIGTSSRIVPTPGGGQFTVGVLVQSNFGGRLEINGAPFWKEYQQDKNETPSRKKHDGSCMMVIATDAPLSARNLKRLARRALHGMARTGASMSNGSGDYAIAFSTAYHIPHRTDLSIRPPPLLHNDHMSPLFLAAIEATEEAIYNSLLQATTVHGHQGTIEAIPLDAVLRIWRKYR